MSHPVNEPGNPAEVPPFAPAPATPSPPPGPNLTTRGHRLVPIVALVVALLLVVSAATVLLLAQRERSNRALGRQRAEITQLRQDLAAKDAELAKAKQDLAAARDQAEALQRAASQHKACQDAISDFFGAVEKEDDEAAGLAMIKIMANCEGVKFDI